MQVFRQIQHVGFRHRLAFIVLEYFDEPAEALDGAAPEIAVVAYASCAFVLGFIIFAHPLLDLAAGAAKSLF